MGVDNPWVHKSEVLLNSFPYPGRPMSIGQTQLAFKWAKQTEEEALKYSS